MAEPRWLLVRGFPHWLKASEKESLLRHFGATEVAVMPSRGRARNCVFATFASHEDAKRGLGRLHQLCVLQSRLVVEYVQDKHSLQDTRQDTRQDTTEEDDGDDDDGSLNEKSPTSSAGPPLPPPPAPRLSYHYPPPSPSTLSNITHTLATIPKFYVQVLHLMNLMNIPPPFGLPLPPPPHMGQGGEEGGSEEESEVGSDGEGGAPDRQVRPCRKVKRRTALLGASKGLSPPPLKRRSVEPQFELVSPLQVTKKISLNVPSKMEPRPPDKNTVISIATMQVATKSPQMVVVPLHEETVSETSGEGGEGGEGGVKEREEFISSEELARNRLSDQEMKEVSVFRGYSAGEPSLRLYIKNLARQTTEQELRYVYGRYVNWADERERKAFDIRLMQSGRMKGQAFVGLATEAAATAAVTETNGYCLAGKPMVVHFARTAKAKPGPLASS